MPNTSSVLVGTTVPKVQTSVSTLAVVKLAFGWNNGSPVSREVHAGFCEKLRVRFPRLTHLSRFDANLRFDLLVVTIFS